ncbi:hypothetical protein SAMN05216223_106104 [Actinacidiphila yanglinensis]|uniref:Uncharacterized protein n=1 Tax=Actinacidiphila yanglinensis TaxID=310779 RepID=A0A1H6AZT5_9ACTN|nr:hypothetical protein [Actinacidiphila yanglinensis]SEG54121.1 hypothetical protein SAMN05216223_106104 [Actinacidiphila yanglinensis]
MTEQNTAPEPENPEVEAHAAEEVLGLQKISIDEEARAGLVAMSCSSCVGSIC